MKALHRDKLQFRVNGHVVFDVPLWFVFYTATQQMPAPGSVAECRVTFGDVVHCVVVDFPTADDPDEDGE
jgi:hypothetical protein